MKKTLAIVFVAIFVVAGVVGVTAAVASKNAPQKTALDDTNEKATSSNLYEVVEFVPPKKTVYSLSEVYSIDISTEKGEEKFVQQVNFDGTGMSMTIKNQQTGKTNKYEYSCQYFNLDGQEIKSEDPLAFNFNPGVNTVLTAGEYTTEIMLTTEDNESVLHEMTFTLVEDTSENTQTPTEKPSEAETQPNKPVADKNNDKDNKEEESAETLVIPQLRNFWYHSNNPNRCTIEITNQNENTLSLTICSSNENATKIATAKVTVTLNDVYEDNIIRGNGSFEYTDSFGNSGTGTLNVSENVILMVINEEYNAGRGFGISNSTGKYL